MTKIDDLLKYYEEITNMRKSKQNQESNSGTGSKNTIKVTRAREFENGGLVFDMVVNGVTIYGCQWVEGEKDGRDYAFVSFPSRQSKKDKKWYNIAYVKWLKEFMLENPPVPAVEKV